MKQYLSQLIAACHLQNNPFAIDAIEHAIQNGTIVLAQDLATDTIDVIANYDEIVADYHLHLRDAHLRKIEFAALDLAA